MKHTEYIIPIGEDAQDYDEMFIGVIRRQTELVRCKDCKWYEFDRKMHCGLPHGVRSKDDYCSDAERKDK